MKYKKKSVTLRWLFTLLVLAGIYYFQERPVVSSNLPIELYETNDHLRNLYLSAIQGAKESIHLTMYSLSDQSLINALNQKSREGVSIQVIHDAKTDQTGFNKLQSIEHHGLEMSGLMHQKILIIDKENVWIGSANFTTESLRLHDNLVSKVISPELAQTLLNHQLNRNFLIGNQLFEMWQLPEDKDAGLERLLALIQGATKTIRVAMYTWTHTGLTDAICAAHKRGIKVEIILDRGQAEGVGKKALKKLTRSGVPVWLSSGQKLLHHKCMWVDEKTLVNGSANWTKAAFSRNKDCFFILHNLTEEQNAKLEQMWKRTRVLSKKKKSSTIVFLDEVQFIRFRKNGQRGASNCRSSWTHLSLVA